MVKNRVITRLNKATAGEMGGGVNERINKKNVIEKHSRTNSDYEKA